MRFRQAWLIISLTLLAIFALVLFAITHDKAVTHRIDPVNYYLWGVTPYVIMSILLIFIRREVAAITLTTISAGIIFMFGTYNIAESSSRDELRWQFILSVVSAGLLVPVMLLKKWLLPRGS